MEKYMYSIVVEFQIIKCINIILYFPRGQQYCKSLCWVVFDTKGAFTVKQNLLNNCRYWAELISNCILKLFIFCVYKCLFFLLLHEILPHDHMWSCISVCLSLNKCIKELELERKRNFWWNLFYLQSTGTSKGLWCFCGAFLRRLLTVWFYQH